MSDSCQRNCSRDPGQLEGDADIGGIGVVVGFVGTSWFAIVLVVINYLLVFEPEQDPFPGANRASQWKQNHVDATQFIRRACVKARLQKGGTGAEILKQVNRAKVPLRPVRIPSSRHLESRISQSILGIGDLQLLTGLGILLSGYSQLRCYISAYHWQLIAYLAWFSNLTHVACLIVLRKYLYENQFERHFRLGLMIILWVGLIVAFVPTTSFNWVVNNEPTAALPASDARCFFDVRLANTIHDEKGCIHLSQLPWFLRKACDAEDAVPYPRTSTSAYESAVITIVLVVFSFFTRSIKLLRTLSTGTKTLVRGTVSRWFTSACIRSSLRSKHLFAYKIHVAHFWAAVYLTGKLYADLLSSDTSDVYWLIVSACWGTLRISTLRGSFRLDENGWNFGQILPVFLLLGPALLLCISILSHRRQVKRLQQDQEEQQEDLELASVNLEPVPMAQSRQNDLLRFDFDPPDRVAVDAYFATHHEEGELGTVAGSSYDSNRAWTPSVHSSNSATAGTDQGTIRDGETSRRPGSDQQHITEESEVEQRTAAVDGRATDDERRKKKHTEWVTLVQNFILLDPDTSLEDIRTVLNEYYTNSAWMADIPLNLAQIQIMALTISFFTIIGGLVRARPTIVMAAFGTNILIVQPFNCVIAIQADFYLGPSHLLRERLPLPTAPVLPPLLFWMLLLLSVVPAAVSITVGFDLVMQMSVYITGAAFLKMWHGRGLRRETPPPTSRTASPSSADVSAGSATITAPTSTTDAVADDSSERETQQHIPNGGVT
ncbi:hypothetical protein B0I35DRAFT_406413 [Stachybotrys elegans]|uniref:Uncharacterized protein n=1 Tax=Stachybotrys elegans TaxID=80388 RepID=A0A8K0SWE5_9HYPO|nr:hypothetical protein B0I35DRAFT_406413 [Stachybotrys elegans]